jgi:hypothetical protein
MNIYDFLNTLEREMEHSNKSFIGNMVYDENKFLRDLTFCEWIAIYLKWMEFSTEEDCKNFYGDN